MATAVSTDTETTPPATSEEDKGQPQPQPPTTPKKSDELDMKTKLNEGDDRDGSHFSVQFLEKIIRTSKRCPFCPAKGAGRLPANDHSLELYIIESGLVGKQNIECGECKKLETVYSCDDPALLPKDKRLSISGDEIRISCKKIHHFEVLHDLMEMLHIAATENTKLRREKHGEVANFILYNARQVCEEWCKPEHADLRCRKYLRLREETLLTTYNPTFTSDCNEEYREMYGMMATSFRQNKEKILLLLDLIKQSLIDCPTTLNCMLWYCIAMMHCENYHNFKERYDPRTFMRIDSNDYTTLQEHYLSLDVPLGIKKIPVIFILFEIPRFYHYVAFLDERLGKKKMRFELTRQEEDVLSVLDREARKLGIKRLPKTGVMVSPESHLDFLTKKEEREREMIYVSCRERERKALKKEKAKDRGNPKKKKKRIGSAFKSHGVDWSKKVSNSEAPPSPVVGKEHKNKPEQGTKGDTKEEEPNLDQKDIAVPNGDNEGNETVANEEPSLITEATAEVVEEASTKEDQELSNKSDNTVTNDDGKPTKTKQSRSESESSTTTSESDKTTDESSESVESETTATSETHHPQTPPTRTQRRIAADGGSVCEPDGSDSEEEGEGGGLQQVKRSQNSHDGGTGGDSTATSDEIVNDIVNRSFDAPKSVVAQSGAKWEQRNGKLECFRNVETETSESEGIETPESKHSASLHAQQQQDTEEKLKGSDEDSTTSDAPSIELLRSASRHSSQEPPPTQDSDGEAIVSDANTLLDSSKPQDSFKDEAKAIESVSDPYTLTLSCSADGDDSGDDSDGESANGDSDEADEDDDDDDDSSDEYHDPMDFDCLQFNSREARENAELATSFAALTGKPSNNNSPPPSVSKEESHFDIQKEIDHTKDDSDPSIDTKRENGPTSDVKKEDTQSADIKEDTRPLSDSKGENGPTLDVKKDDSQGPDIKEESGLPPDSKGKTGAKKRKKRKPVKNEILNSMNVRIDLSDILSKEPMPPVLREGHELLEKYKQEERDGISISDAEQQEEEERQKHDPDDVDVEELGPLTVRPILGRGGTIALVSKDKDRVITDVERSMMRGSMAVLNERVKAKGMVLKSVLDVYEFLIMHDEAPEELPKVYINVNKHGKVAREGDSEEYTDCSDEDEEDEEEEEEEKEKGKEDEEEKEEEEKMEEGKEEEEKMEVEKMEEEKKVENEEVVTSPPKKEEDPVPMETSPPKEEPQVQTDKPPEKQTEKPPVKPVEESKPPEKAPEKASETPPQKVPETMPQRAPLKEVTPPPTPTITPPEPPKPPPRKKQKMPITLDDWQNMDLPPEADEFREPTFSRKPGAKGKFKVYMTPEDVPERLIRTMDPEVQEQLHNDKIKSLRRKGYRNPERYIREQAAAEDRTAARRELERKIRKKQAASIAFDAKHASKLKAPLTKEPLKKEPSKTEPSKTEASKTEASKTEASKTEPSKTEDPTKKSLDEARLRERERHRIRYEEERRMMELEEEEYRMRAKERKYMMSEDRGKMMLRGDEKKALMVTDEPKRQKISMDTAAALASVLQEPPGYEQTPRVVSTHDFRSNLVDHLRKNEASIANKKLQPYTSLIPDDSKSTKPRLLHIPGYPPLTVPAPPPEVTKGGRNSARRAKREAKKAEKKRYDNKSVLVAQVDTELLRTQGFKVNEDCTKTTVIANRDGTIEHVMEGFSTPDEVKHFLSKKYNIVSQKKGTGYITAPEKPAAAKKSSRRNNKKKKPKVPGSGPQPEEEEVKVNDKATGLSGFPFTNEWTDEKREIFKRHLVKGLEKVTPVSEALTSTSVKDDPPSLPPSSPAAASASTNETRKVQSSLSSSSDKDLDAKPGSKKSGSKDPGFITTTIDDPPSICEIVDASEEKKLPKESSSSSPAEKGKPPSSDQGKSPDNNRKPPDNNGKPPSTETASNPPAATGSDVKKTSNVTVHTKVIKDENTRTRVTVRDLTHCNKAEILDDFEAEEIYKTVLCNYGDSVHTDYRTFTLPLDVKNRKRCLELLSDTEIMRSFIRKYHSTDRYPENPDTVPDLQFEADLRFLNKHLTVVPIDKSIQETLDDRATNPATLEAEAYTSSYDKASGGEVKTGSATWGRRPPKSSLLESASSKFLMSAISYSKDSITTATSADGSSKTSGGSDGKKSSTDKKTAEVKKTVPETKKSTSEVTKKATSTDSKKPAISKSKSSESQSVTPVKSIETTEKKAAKSSPPLVKSSKATDSKAASTAKSSSSEKSEKGKKTLLSSSSSSSVTDSESSKTKGGKKTKKSSKSSTPKEPSYFDDIDTVFDIPLLDLTNQIPGEKTDKALPKISRKPVSKEFELSVEQMMQAKLAKLGIATAKAASPITPIQPLPKTEPTIKDTLKEEESKATADSSKGGKLTARDRFKTCENCGIEIVERILVCSSCKKVAYCNYRCQKTHWKLHKKSCSYSKKGSHDRTG